MVNADDYAAPHLLDGTPGMLLDAAGNEVNPASLTVSGTSDGLASLFTTIATIPAPVTAFDTSGYDTPGIGGARYIYDAAVNAAYVTANPRTAKMIGARGFKLDPAQHLTIEMFGGKTGGTMATNGANNYAAMWAAHHFDTDTSDHSPPIHYGRGSYYCNATLEPQAAFIIKGANTGLYSGDLVGYVRTRLIFPASTTCFRIKTGYTSGLGVEAVPFANGSATGSIIEGVCIQQETLGGGITAHGVHARAQVTLRHCEFTNIAGHCIMIGATAGTGGTTEGNANNWTVEHCFGHVSNGDMLYVWGADANAGTSLKVQSHNGVKGCCIRDESTLGNVHIGPQATGYGDKGVTYNGVQYQLHGSDVNDTVGGATTPGTNPGVWYPLRTGVASGRFPEWAPGGTYRMAIPLLIDQRSVVFGGYEEHGSVQCRILGTIFGGNFTLSSDSNGMTNDLPSALSNQQAVGYYQSVSGDLAQPFAVKNGTSAYTLVGTTNFYNASERRNILSHYVQQDGEVLDWYWFGKDSLLAYRNREPMWMMTGPATAKTFGRAGAQPYRMGLLNPLIINSNLNDGRTIGYTFGGAGAITGEHARGDILLDGYHRSSFPAALHVCTVAGTPGTFRTIASVTGKGATRPSEIQAGDVGVMFLDTNLAAAGKPIWWTGTAWVDATGAVV